MLFYLLSQQEVEQILNQLGYNCPETMLQTCFDYYYPRTSHGSTLSKVVHAYVGHLLGKMGMAKDLFIESLESDIYDTQGGTTQEGIHAGVMGATIDIFLRIFAGLEFKGDHICLSPKLDKDCKGIKFHVRFRNIWYWITMDDTHVYIKAIPVHEFTVQPHHPIAIEVNNRQISIFPGQEHIIDLANNHERNPDF
jgi:trehalose/maltose hydrolase-like predicted phosphorylase